MYTELEKKYIDNMSTPQWLLFYLFNKNYVEFICEQILKLNLTSRSCSYPPLFSVSSLRDGQIQM